MTGDDDRPQPGYTWLDDKIGRLTMGLYLEQSNLLTTRPKPQKRIAQVFEKSEAEYIYCDISINSAVMGHRPFPNAEKSWWSQ